MIDEYTGKKIVSPLDLPDPKPWAPTICHEDQIQRLVKQLIDLSSEAYADLLEILYSDKFTLQHAILLLVVLRRMDCCELGPLEIADVKYT